MPQFDGINSVPYYTSDNIFNLTQQPNRMLIIGAGPIGCELGQAFQRLGTQVTFMTRSGLVLPRDDRKAADFLAKQLHEDGCEFASQSVIDRLSLISNKPRVSESKNGGYQITSNPEILVNYSQGSAQKELVVDAVLFCTGRTPNVENMGLKEAGVEYDPEDGIIVSDQYQTANKDIFAVGDCIAARFSNKKKDCQMYPGKGPSFTHNSDV